MVTTAERIMRLFRGNERAHGVFNVTQSRDADGKKQGNARILKEQYTLQMWEDHLEGKNGLGIVPIKDDNTCDWGAIDIDKYDLDHKKLIEKLHKAGIPGIVGRSKSGGGHVYFFFAEPIAAADVNPKLMAIAALIGHGGSEVFPKQKELLVERGDIGNFLNMPYFNGTQSMRWLFDHKGQAMEVDEFVEYAEARLLTEEAFLGLQTTKPKAKNTESPLRDGPPCLQHLVAQGFGEGSRNNALFNLAVYAKQAHPEDWQAQVQRYNIEHMIPPLNHGEVGVIIKQLEKKGDYYYKCNDQPIKPFCNKELCLGRKYGVGHEAAHLANLVKIEGDPPIYFLNVDGKRVELTIEHLHNQGKFRMAVTQQVNKMVRTVKGNLWESRMAELVEEMTIVEAESGVTLEELLLDHLRDFCCMRSKGIEPRDIYGKIPVTLGEKIFFRLADFMEHLVENRFQEWSLTKVGEVLKKHGAQGVPLFETPGSHQKNTRGVWSIDKAYFGDIPDQDAEPILPPRRKKDIL